MEANARKDGDEQKEEKWRIEPLMKAFAGLTVAPRGEYRFPGGGVAGGESSSLGKTQELEGAASEEARGDAAVLEAVGKKNEEEYEDEDTEDTEEDTEDPHRYEEGDEEENRSRRENDNINNNMVEEHRAANKDTQQQDTHLSAIHETDDVQRQISAIDTAVEIGHMTICDGQ